MQEIVQELMEVVGSSHPFLVKKEFIEILGHLQNSKKSLGNKSSSDVQDNPVQLVYDDVED